MDNASAAQHRGRVLLEEPTTIDARPTSNNGGSAQNDVRFKGVPRSSLGQRFHEFLVVSFETIMQFVFKLPRYRACNGLKAVFLRLNGAKVGQRVIFYPGVWMTPARNLVIGDDVDLALDVLVQSSGGVTIGDRALIGYRTFITSGNHVIPPKPGRIFDAGAICKPVVIENDVWIGAYCVILPGVTIGEGAVIAAGSVVTRSVEPFTVVGGCPAKVIRTRSDTRSP
jgi:acetyltransferase-like isoleucine patch superfamily enzyme